MTVMVPTTLLSVIVLIDRSLVAGQSVKASPESDTVTVVGGHWSRDMAEEKVNWQGLDLSTEPKITGHKWTSEDYHTLSSLTSHDDDDDRQSPTRTDDRSPKEPGKSDSAYPVLTTNSPSSYFGRNKYGGGRYYHLLSAGKEPSTDVDVVLDNDQLPEYSAVPPVIPIPVPRWNRYQFGHRQLKKYGPTMVDSDVTLVDGGYNGGYNSGYNDNNMDYAVNSYDVENFEAPSGDSDGVIGWYGGERPMLSARPSPVAAATEHRKSGYKMSYRGLGLLALFKLGLVKMAAFKFIKSMLLFAIKLKLFLLFKLIAFVKFFVLSKLLKLFVLPMLPNLQSLLMMLLNPLTSSSMPMNMMPMNMMPMNMTLFGKDVELSGQVRNVSGVVEPLDMRSTDIGTQVDQASLFQFMTAVNTARCVERMACYVAGTRPPSFQSVWTNWIVTSLVDYIPNDKLKSYMSTFKDVSDHRLGNMFNNPSPDQWLNWCNQRYSCDQEIVDD